MKIGILTFHSAKNYGAVLQAYALKTILIGLGHQVFIIDRRKKAVTMKHKLIDCFHPAAIRGRYVWKNFDKFSKKQLVPKTKLFGNDKSLSSFDNEAFDIVIVGSDQVWRLEFSSIGLNYYLNFIDSTKTKKISYAASFGLEVWSENIETTNQIRPLIKDFAAISVRERSAVDICHNIFGVDAKLVADPTLLLQQADYEALLSSPQIISTDKKTFVSYMLGVDQSAISYLHSFASLLSLDYFDLYNLSTVKTKTLFGYTQKQHISVEQWLDEIKNAEYVVTNSFHATIFSIIYGKQFLVVDHQKGGSDRIKTLLDLVDLTDRYVDSIEAISLEHLNRFIDYSQVQHKITKFKETSMKFLIENLV